MTGGDEGLSSGFRDNFGEDGRDILIGIRWSAPRPDLKAAGTTGGEEGARTELKLGSISSINGENIPGMLSCGNLVFAFLVALALAFPPLVALVAL